MPFYHLKEKNFILVAIRKCGTISIKHFLKRSNLATRFLKLKELKQLLLNNEDIKIVAIVRNPWSRCISSWQRARFIEPERFKTDITQPSLESFKNFIKEHQSIKDRHWQRQTAYLKRFKTYTFIKIEEINDHIVDVFGEELTLPHKHDHRNEKNKIKVDNYREFYDEEAKILVERIYKDDIDKFGYKF